jgi:hypothetical protein
MLRCKGYDLVMIKVYTRRWWAAHSGEGGLVVGSPLEESCDAARGLTDCLADLGQHRVRHLLF